MIETANVVAAATAAATIYNMDITTSTVLYYTQPSTAASGFTLNIRGNSTTSVNSLLPVGDALTVVFLNTTGAVTTSYPSTITIDGATQVIKWTNGIAPTAGNTSSLDAYTYTILKTDVNTYTVLGSQTRFA